MDVWDAIETRIEVNEYADDPVDDETKRKILNAGRLASSGLNEQHWEFIFVDDPADVEQLGELSPTGGWVAGADFAVVVCTNPEFDFHEIDAGRAVTYMQLAAWEDGVGSRIYTVDQQAVKDFLNVPDDYSLTLVAGFGHPEAEIQGIKDRDPLETVASSGRFGSDLDLVD